MTREIFIDPPAALEGADPLEILRWAAATYGEGICFATVLDAEGVALASMIGEAALPIPVLMPDTLDTPLQAFRLREQLRQRYGLAIRLVWPPLAGSAFMADYGWAPRHLDRAHRWEPLRAVLARYAARISARRRDMRPAWQAMPVVEWDDHFGLAQVNPLAAWDEARVAAYLSSRGLEVPAASPAAPEGPADALDIALTL